MSNLVQGAFSAFGDSLLESLKNRKTDNALDSLMVGNKTPAQVLALVNQTSVGLGLLSNYQMAAPMSFANSSYSDKRYTSPFITKYYLTYRTELSSSVLGNVFAGLAGGNVETGRLCHRLNLVSTDTELDSVKNYKESFGNVFNNWSRISHNASGVFPANPIEINNWTYNSATDTISCTVNSVTLIGFISPDSFENFDFEVEVSSTNSDDDYIGVVIAFAEIDGKQYTLNLWRGWCDTTCNFAIQYNQSQPGTVILTKSSCGLANPNPYHTSLGTLKNGWVGSGPVRLKVQRVGNIITCYTTTPGAPNDYLTNHSLTVDLDANELLKKFKGPQRFGYCCYSQLNSSWKSIVRPGDKVPIVDTRNMDCYLPVDGSWVKQPAGTHRNHLAKNRLFTNQITGKLFFVGKSLDAAFEIVKGA